MGVEDWAKNLLNKFTPPEKIEGDETDGDGKKYDEAKLEITEDHKNADPEVIERLTREKLERDLEKARENVDKAGKI